MKDYDATTYGQSFADVYDDWYGDISDIAATTALIVELARRTPGRPVLELAVGTGRLAIPIAATGVDVIGIDSSEAMLRRLADKPGGASVQTVLGHMVHDLPDGPFGVAFIAYNSLFALPPDERAACLRAVGERLAPGGAFVLEAFVPDSGRPAGHTIDVRSMSAHHVVLSIDVHHPDDRRAEGQFVEITESGGVRLRPWVVHYASPTELDADAAAAGLDLVERFEDWDRSPFDDLSARHVSVYRRR